MIIDNFTCITSTDRKFIENPTVLYTSGPQNITALNMNFNDNYASSLNPKASFMISILSECQPNDGLLKTIDVHGGSYSLPNNQDGTKMNMLFLQTNGNLYREIKINITNQHFMNYQLSSGQLLYLVGMLSVEIYASNIIFENVESDIYYAGFIFFKKAMIDTLSFKSISTSQTKPALTVEACLAAIITGITFDNINGTEGTSLPLVSLSNFPSSFIQISGIKLINSYMMNRMLFKNFAPLQTLTISGGEYSGIYQSNGGVLLATGIIGELVFINHTFTKILSADTTDTTSKILEITDIDLSFGLNSTIQDISVSNSTSGVLGFNGITNSHTLT